MKLFILNLKSLYFRRSSIALTIFSLALSVFLYFTIIQINISAKESFTDSISKTDLIVGQKTGPINLLLYAIFHKGAAINNINYQDYQIIKQNPQIAWTIPISLGDSYQNYRVVATDENYFTHYRFSDNKQISFSKGQWFSNIDEIVVGHTVAKKLNLKIGQTININHGITQGLEEQAHNQINFKITGIINKTATPIDSALYINLEAMEAIHDSEYQVGKKYEISTITSFLIGSKSRIYTLYLQNAIDNYKASPLMAIIPGVTLNSIWQLIFQAQTALDIVTYALLLISFIGLITNLLSQLNERRRELAILRSQGMSAKFIILFILCEALIVAFISFVIGIIAKFIILYLSRTLIFEIFSINIEQVFDFAYIFNFFIVYIGIALIIGFIPAIKAYKYSVKDGLSIKF